MSVDYLVQQLAEIRMEVAALKADRVTHRAGLEVIAVDPATSTFAVAVPGADDLTGIEAPAQFLPAAGDLVRLRLAGAIPIYDPSAIAENAVSTRELDPEVTGAIGDAATAAENAQTAAGQAQTAASNAVTAAGDAQTAAAAAETAAGNAQSTADGATTAANSAQTAANNAQVAADTAAAAASQALTIANGKNTTYVSDTRPTAPSGGFVINDEWIDIGSTGPRLLTWNGSDWAPRQWGTGAIAAGAVTANEIAAATITGTKIAAGTITAGLIAAGTITAGQIAAAAITTAKIAAGAVTANEIAAATITGTKIAAATITGANLVAGTITATQIAAGTITGAKLVAGAVTANQIAAATITGAKIASGTITAANIAAGTITASQIAAGAITAVKLDANAINGKTITGATLRTAASGQRIQVDSTNGLVGYDSAGLIKTKVGTDGRLFATGATINGEITTADSGPRVRISQATSQIYGATQEVGSLQFFSGVGGETPATITRTANLSAGSIQGGTLAIDAGALNDIGPRLLLSIEEDPVGGYRAGTTLESQVTRIEGEVYLTDAQDTSQATSVATVGYVKSRSVRPVTMAYYPKFAAFGGFQPARVWREGDTMFLVGFIKVAQAIAAGEEPPIIGLPPEWRPTGGPLRMPGGVLNGTQAVSVDIESNGDVQFLNQLGRTVNVNENLALSLTWPLL